MNFIKSNPHPTGKKIGDCVIRALSYAESKKWIDVYNELCAIGSAVFNLPNSQQVYETYLLQHGWVKQKMPKHSSGKRMKLKEFIEQNPDISFVAKIVGHITFVEKGHLIDTWDCSRKCIGNYYTK